VGVPKQGGLQVDALKPGAPQIGALKIRSALAALLLSIIDATPTAGELKTGEVGSEDSSPSKIRSLKIGAAQVRLGKEGLAEVSTTQVTIGQGECHDLFEPLCPFGLVLTLQYCEDLR
jgi:hypothetical protein